MSSPADTPSPYPLNFAPQFSQSFAPQFSPGYRQAPPQFNQQAPDFYQQETPQYFQQQQPAQYFQQPQQLQAPQQEQAPMSTSPKPVKKKQTNSQPRYFSRVFPFSPFFAIATETRQGQALEEQAQA